MEKGAILITIRGPLKVHNWVQHQINQSIEQSAQTPMKITSGNVPPFS